MRFVFLQNSLNCDLSVFSSFELCPFGKEVKRAYIAALAPLSASAPEARSCAVCFLQLNSSVNERLIQQRPQLRFMRRFVC